MAAGRPLVVANAESLPDLVREAGAGVVVADNEPENFAGAIAILLNNLQMRIEYGRKGREFAKTQSWAAVARRYIALAQTL